MPLIADKVKENTATTGTGTITLAGAVTGCRTFASAFSNGNSVYYSIASGNNWEVGIGVYNAGTLTRDTVLSSSNSNALITLVGTSVVFCTIPADQFKPDYSNTFLLMGA